MPRRRMEVTLWVGIIAAVTTLIYSGALLRGARNSGTVSPIASIRFRNALCARTDAWCQVTLENNAAGKPIFAGARLLESEQMFSYAAIVHQDGSVVVDIATIGMAPVATVVFPNADSGDTPKQSAPIPPRLLDRAAEFAEVLRRALRP